MSQKELIESEQKIQEERISRLREHALKFPDCPTCKRQIETGNYTGPGHEPSSLCRSGGYSHCSCDFCF
jgi:hypothetical protein